MLFLHGYEYCGIEKASSHNLIQVQGLCLCIYVIGDNGDLPHRQQIQLLKFGLCGCTSEPPSKIMVLDQRLNII